jgi:hypothetical protein
MTVELSSRVKEGECAKCGFQFPRDVLYDAYYIIFDTSADEGHESDEVEVCQKCWHDVMTFAVPRGTRK